MPHIRSTARSLAAATLIAASISASAADKPNHNAAPQFGTWGVDLAGRNLSISPGADFYLYADGTWIAQTKLPPDKPKYDQLDRINDSAQAAIRKLIENAAAGRSSDHDAGRVGAAYRSFMDEARVDELDAKPLAPDLARIRAEQSGTDVAALMGTQHTSQQSAIIGLEISPDEKAPDRRVVILRVMGAGLPDRDYYLKPEFAEVKTRYQAYVASILQMIGWPTPDANAKAVVDFETKLAQARWTRVQMRDPNANYHAMTVEELAHYAPGFDFRRLLDNAELGAVDHVIIRTDTAFPKYAAIFAAAPLDTIKAWQAFSLVNASAAFLSRRFVDANFAFYRTLTGQEENEPRWKRAVAFADAALGEAIGRMYVTSYFPPSAKTQAETMVRQIIAAMHTRIERVTWMSAATKAKAQDKLSHLAIKVGYPAKWRSYDTLAMTPADLYGNAVRAGSFDWEYLVHRLDQPVDRTEWNMTPQTVNAQYDPTNNDLTLPAAILQPPFFDPNADLAVNYGAIGTVIGHETTHGFDDQGRKYDAAGRLADWWAPQDAAAFQARADRLGAQFDKFEPVKGHHVNGQLTMGENIADLGGLLLSLDAYHAALGDKPAPVLDGLTGDQRFYLAYAQIWRMKVSDQAAILLVQTDPHSPGHFRIDGPVRNIDAWYKAFNVGPNDAMYLAPKDRVSVW